jgi:hypothetical protein
MLKHFLAATLECPWIKALSKTGMYCSVLDDLDATHLFYCRI